ncbi:hypothetical protein [Algihabitans albus]|uniref:hypothetical protein n=1 Tax=Algihabitans albus TaxID=2164067 RepID=UPI000E5C86AB|nr:hypothetical protein [Algihabitans albus]
MRTTSDMKAVVLLHDDDCAAFQLDGWLQECGTKTVYSARSLANVEAALVGGSIDLAIVLMNESWGTADGVLQQLGMAQVPVLVLDSSSNYVSAQHDCKPAEARKVAIDRFPRDRDSLETAIKRAMTAS